jgi:hypothetical protein
MGLIIGKIQISAYSIAFGSQFCTAPCIVSQLALSTSLWEASDMIDLACARSLPISLGRIYPNSCELQSFGSCTTLSTLLPNSIRKGFVPFSWHSRIASFPSSSWKKPLSEKPKKKWPRGRRHRCKVIPASLPRPQLSTCLSLCLSLCLDLCATGMITHCPPSLDSALEPSSPRGRLLLSLQPRRGCRRGSDYLINRLLLQSHFVSIQGVQLELNSLCWT